MYHATIGDDDVFTNSETRMYMEINAVTEEINLGSNKRTADLEFDFWAMEWPCP